MGQLCDLSHMAVWIKLFSFVSLWKQLIKLLLFICFELRFQSIIVFNYKYCIYAKEPQKPFLWNKPASIVCILWYDLRVRLCTHACCKTCAQTYRSGGVFACFRGGVRWRLLIVKVWIPVGSCGDWWDFHRSLFLFRCCFILCQPCVAC